jgi:NAD(P)-dependent dehydrogenase (short-subunit alcohol dehydrogenase family)
MRFSKRTVFVTGASRGIGAALARAFRAEGARVIGTRTGAASNDDGSCQEWITADFVRMNDIRSCADEVRRCAPDILVNNAGMNKIGPFADIDPADFLRIQQVNVFAPFLLCQAAIPGMKERRWGRIVNIASIWGKVSKRYRASYSASKFALDGLTVSLAAEYAADGILANCVSPGIINTELTQRVLGEDGIRDIVTSIPSKRLGEADEIARLVLWLASDENTYLAGQNIAIDGGFTRV